MHLQLNHQGIILNSEIMYLFFFLIVACRFTSFKKATWKHCAWVITLHVVNLNFMQNCNFTLHNTVKPIFIPCLTKLRIDADCPSCTITQEADKCVTSPLGFWNDAAKILHHIHNVFTCIFEESSI